MKPADAAEMNRLSRMTREQREEEWLKELYGTLGNAFPAFRKPAIREQVHPVTDDLDEPRCDCGAIDREPHWDECALWERLTEDDE